MLLVVSWYTHAPWCAYASQIENLVLKSSNAKERSYRDLDPNATIFILTDNVNRATPKNYQGQASSFDKDYEGQDASFDKIDRTPYSTFMDSLVNFLSSEKPSIAIRTASSAKSKLGSSRGSSLARVIDRVESKTPVLCLDLRERQMEIRDGIYDKRMMALIRDRYSLEMRSTQQPSTLSSSISWFANSSNVLLSNSDQSPSLTSQSRPPLLPPPPAPPMPLTLLLLLDRGLLP